LAVAAGLAVVLIAVRAALPWVLRDLVNRRLAEIPGFAGHVDRVGVQVWHGGYAMHDLTIKLREGRVDRPFVAAREITFSIAYRELWHGRLVSDVTVTDAQLNFIRGRTAAESQNGAGGGWQDVVRDLFPIRINHFVVHGGRIHFEDTASTPRVDVWIEHLQIDATGLRNRPSAHGDALPASVTVAGDTIGGGRLNLGVAAEPLANEPHFRFRGSLKGVALPALNAFLLAYAGVDVSEGDFEVYSEIAGADGGYHGYVKPFLRDLHFETPSDRRKPLTEEVWKGFVAKLEKLLRDRRKGEVATLVPFSGRFGGKPDVQIWAALSNLLHNSFVSDLPRGFEEGAEAGETKTPAAPP
jgi:hypothetical protein